MSRVTPILTEPPSGWQLEILSRSQFAAFLEKRFRGISGEKRLRSLIRRRVLRPILRYQGRAYYSPMQIVLFDSGASLTPTRLAEFERLLALIHEIQDLYVPEVRSNGRRATWVEHRGLMNVTVTYSVGSIRDWRSERLATDIDLRAALAAFGLTMEHLVWWRRTLAMRARSIDPLDAWEDLVSRIDYDERQQLKYEALLAQDYQELGNVVLLLLKDLGAASPYESLRDVFDLAPRDTETGAPHWRVEKYGRDHLDDHFLQLELIANDYDINPKPRAIILTEGDERLALARLFRARGFDPLLLGIEFRSLFGIGDFKFDHWRGFIEYMHEKQVLVYFVIDSERPDLEKQIASFTTKNRRHQVEGLTKVLPKDRIIKWEHSFEESNFTDEEIARALAAQGKTVSVSTITAARTDASRRKGLIKALNLDGLDKPALDIALIDELIGRSDEGPLRPVEEFVDAAGRMIAMNHQPTHATTIAMNRSSGFLG